MIKYQSTYHSQCRATNLSLMNDTLFRRRKFDVIPTNQLATKPYCDAELDCMSEIHQKSRSAMIANFVNQVIPESCHR